MLKRMIVLLMVLLLCGCGAKKAENNTVMIANPFTTHEALAEAEKAADITLTLPEDLSAFPAVYRAANNGTLQLIEVIFDCEGNEVRLRKSPGTEDNSGVYKTFSVIESPEDTVKLYGDSEEQFLLATWQDGEYSYSISCEEGVDFDTLHAWVCSTK